MSSRLLFLCTGNYYRSRFAEMYFNTLAADAGLTWRAGSRGLAVDREDGNVGPISKDTVEELAKVGVTASHPPRDPCQVAEADLAAADLIVALKEAEHRPLLAERYPPWQDHVVYWHVHDLDVADADEALGGLAAQVRQLVRQLSTV